MTRGLHAVQFDMDGLLADSGPIAGALREIGLAALREAARVPGRMGLPGENSLPAGPPVTEES